MVLRVRKHGILPNKGDRVYTKVLGVRVNTTLIFKVFSPKFGDLTFSIPHLFHFEKHLILLLPIRGYSPKGFHRNRKGPSLCHSRKLLGPWALSGLKLPFSRQISDQPNFEHTYLKGPSPSLKVKLLRVPSYSLGISRNRVFGPFQVHFLRRAFSHLQQKGVSHVAFNYVRFSASFNFNLTLGQHTEVALGPLLGPYLNPIRGVKFLLKNLFCPQNSLGPRVGVLTTFLSKKILSNAKFGLMRHYSHHIATGEPHIAYLYAQVGPMALPLHLKVLLKYFPLLQREGSG